MKYFTIFILHISQIFRRKFFALYTLITNTIYLLSRENNNFIIIRYYYPRVTILKEPLTKL